jgi:hypothetical protein
MGGAERFKERGVPPEWGRAFFKIPPLFMEPQKISVKNFLTKFLD